MDLKQFQTESIKTESRVDAIKVDLQYLATIFEILICAGNLLDQVKKNVFYDKAIDPEERAKYITGIIAALDTKELFKDDPTENKQILEVNTRLFHSIVGTATESTELLENLVTGNIDVINMLEEFVDIDWYKAIGIDEVGADWEQMLEKLIDKLKQRYPGKFSAESAINRDTDAERIILDTIEHEHKDDNS